MGFEVIPAIDLRGGRVVRLLEGDYARETDYGDVPLAVALAFAGAGARWIHVVDLDGAKGEARQSAVIAGVVDALGDDVAVEVGGGLRSAAAVDEVLRAGAARVILGTAILRDPALAGELIRRHGSAAIVAALDIRGEQAVGDGWVAGGTARNAEEALSALADQGVARFVVTSIARDGALRGPDLDLLGWLVRRDRGAIVASGGVTSIADLRAARDIGCEGAIVGRALYEGVLDLAEAIAALGAAAPR